MSGRKRRRFSAEFKKEAVGLITEQGYTIAEAARNLGIHSTVLGRWKREFEAERDDTAAEPGKASVRMELRRLRQENKRLRMEREILKEAAAFFAKESD